MRVASALVAAMLIAACSEPPPPEPRVEHPAVFCPTPIGNVGLAPTCVAIDFHGDLPHVAPVASEKQKWEAAHGGESAARPQLKRRLAGWPNHLLTDPTTLPEDGRRFLRRVAADTWRGLATFVDREHGLPVDHVTFLDKIVDGPDFRIGDYTNASTLGLYLIAIVAARELEFVAPEEALARTRLLVDTVRQLEDHDGFLFNYYDTTSLERTSNFVSFVDSAWWSAGMIVARAAFPALAPVLDDLIARQDYGFFYDEALRRMSHGYDVELRERSRYHYGALFTEARVGSLIAIGKNDVPVSHWQAMDLNPPAACGAVPAWLECADQPGVQPFRRADGQWAGVAFAPSWGGSMFEALMPGLVIDEIGHSPAALGANQVAHATVQRRYAYEQLGLAVWGMSPAMNPGTGRYDEFGVALLGSRGYPEGVVAPYASALALATAPAEATENLRQLALRYPIYGEMGFFDSVDPKSGTVSYSYLALDQAMILIAIANHLGDHAIQRLFETDPIIAGTLPLLSAEHWFE